MSSVVVENGGIPVSEDNALWSADINSFVKQAIREVYATYGDVVSVVDKKKSLLKFGQNESVGTSEATIMEFLGSEVDVSYPSTNDFDSFSCTDNSFTGYVAIEGHYWSGSLLVFKAQIVQANGNTRVALDQALSRVTRMECYDETEFNASTDQCYVFANTTLSSGVPVDTSKINLLMTAKERQSKKTATSVSSTDYAFITKIYADINKKTSASADIRFRVREIGSGTGRRPGGFKTKLIRTLDSTSKPDFSIDYSPFFVVPKTSDMKLTAEGSTTGVSVSGGIEMLLAKVVG